MRGLQEFYIGKFRNMAIRVGRARGRPTANAELMDDMRRIQARLDAMETGRKRDPDAGDVSEPKEETQAEEEAPTQETVELRFLRSIFGESSRPKPELHVYDGNLTVGNIIDWISDLD